MVIITITIGGINYTVIIYDGKAIFDIPDLDVGNYTIPVYYSGDDYYAPVNIYVNLSVGEEKPDVITADDVTNTMVTLKDLLWLSLIIKEIL